MTRLLAVAAALLAALTMSGGSALAAVVPGNLDQLETDASAAGASWGHANSLAQTFTAGNDGTLNAFALYVGAQLRGRIGGGPAIAAASSGSSAQVAIMRTTAGLPNGQYLYGPTEVTLPAGSGWVGFVLPAPAAIVKGTQYSILLSPDLGWSITWAGDCRADNYAGGEALVFDPAHHWQSATYWGTANAVAGACQRDFAFQTYLTPAPAASASPLPSIQGETSQPTSDQTPPATGTGGSTDDGPARSIVFLVAGLTVVAAFASVRLLSLIQQ